MKCISVRAWTTTLFLLLACVINSNAGNRARSDNNDVPSDLTEPLNLKQPLQTSSFKGEAKHPATCADAMKGKKGNKKGAAFLLEVPDSGLPPFYAYCLKKGKKGRAWTIFQRRSDNRTDFYRDWSDYKKGFGDVSAEYFIGLDNLHALTGAHVNQLWISMKDFKGKKRDAKYNTFAIGNEEEKYALKVLGKYSGTAGDSLRNHVGMKFSTRDAKNDISSTSCAEAYKGAWWYYNCYDSNLNGRYLNGMEGEGEFGQGIEWRTFHANYSLKYVHMAIRPRKKK